MQIPQLVLLKACCGRGMKEFHTLIKAFFEADIKAMSRTIDWRSDNPLVKQFGFKREDIKKRPVIILEDKGIWYWHDVIRNENVLKSIIDMYTKFTDNLETK